MVTVGGTWQNVFVLNADGSNLRKVTPYTILSIVQPCYTRWSPDKSKILFMNCSATDNDRLYVVNTDGTNLTALNAVGIMPAWSPDGTKIGYCIGGNTIAVIPATGGSPVTLVNGNGYYFAWSTDSTKILFTPVSPSSLCTVKADGSSSSPTTLVTSVGDYSYPTYSPDGTKIAVIYATNASGLGNLLVMNSDGTSPVSIAQAAVVDPVEWSPDGTKIAFAGYVSSNEVLYDISSSGTNLVQLSPSGYESDWPHWSPDSQSLVYVEGALNGIYTVKADGTQTTNVYDPYGGDNDSNTEWAPTH
jgi:TolB protein